jgi:hypothetical protein
MPLRRKNATLAQLSIAWPMAQGKRAGVFIVPRIPCLETHPAGLDGSGREVTHETQNVDSAGGRLRRGTGGRNPLSCRFSTTRTRTMSEYRDRG